jgi:hypothetical protein
MVLLSSIRTTAVNGRAGAARPFTRAEIRTGMRTDRFLLTEVSILAGRTAVFKLSATRKTRKM